MISWYYFPLGAATIAGILHAVRVASISRDAGSGSFWDGVRYFSRSEFDSADLPGSGKFMKRGFVTLLDDIRHQLGQPMRVNSGYRTKEHNTAVGGAPASAHTKGLAADIHCPTYGYLLNLVSIASKNGVQRIGTYWTGNSYFVHLDLDYSKGHQKGWAFGMNFPTTALRT